MPDLTLGRHFVLESRSPNTGRGPRTIYPHNQDDLDSLHGRDLALELGNTVILPANSRLLCNTATPVEVPVGEIGLVMLRSTWARIGLIAPPTTVNGGFKGHLTMELFNSNQHHDIVLTVGVDRIWSMTSIQVAGPPELIASDSGRYANQYSVMGPIAEAV